MIGRSSSPNAYHTFRRTATLCASTLAIALAANSFWLTGDRGGVRAQEAIAGREFEFTAPSTPGDPLPNDNSENPASLPDRTLPPSHLDPVPELPSDASSPTASQRVEVPQATYSRTPSNPLPPPALTRPRC